MTISLNAFPILLPDNALIEAQVIPFDAEVLEQLRQDYRATHSFYRRDNTILAFSTDGQYPIEGEAVSINLMDDFRLLCFLFKDGLIRYLKGNGIHLRKPPIHLRIWFSAELPSCYHLLSG